MRGAAAHIECGPHLSADAGAKSVRREPDGPVAYRCGPGGGSNAPSSTVVNSATSRLGPLKFVHERRLEAAKLLKTELCTSFITHELLNSVAVRRQHGEGVERGAKPAPGVDGCRCQPAFGGHCPYRMAVRKRSVLIEGKTIPLLVVVVQSGQADSCSERDRVRFNSRACPKCRVLASRSLVEETASAGCRCLHRRRAPSRERHVAPLAQAPAICGAEWLVHTLQPDAPWAVERRR